eukprot:CAMPEP_0113310812 /NCGR_PEP_ID=MMETSP0010_2-20120614/8307_1 /TAXON_ID=216773 ORGANISM="Corethron hystrix, Strain 308" /NCGR_SAMPLE_ID=MMETSP0010_2 /ASSEMBLY_ACC=CAM_ASM_000155 /LENGTH=78 /DNA_ID=CAMNT_0000166341 /DNA_START=1016 /DNA_END=1250 /DNA_ORIENTATION=+ /assembly_acc=CAM_ASM_000155
MTPVEAKAKIWLSKETVKSGGLLPDFYAVAGEEDVAVVEVGIGDEGRRQGAERARRKNAIGAAERAARKKMPQNARGW